MSIRAFWSIGSKLMLFQARLWRNLTAGKSDQGGLSLPNGENGSRVIRKLRGGSEISAIEDRSVLLGLPSRREIETTPSVAKPIN